MMLRARDCYRSGLVLALAIQAMVSAAQGIDIQTPRLPPRDQAVHGVQPQPESPQPPGSYDAYSASAAGAQAPHGTVDARGQQPTYGSQPPMAAQAPQSAGSPLQQRASMGGFGQGYAGGVASQGRIVAPTASAPGGACRAQPSPDRQAMSLLGPDGLPRRHVGLGDFRVQMVVHSPDGLWAVALTKLRGAPQYAAMTLDLARCETAHVTDLRAAGEDVRFEGDTAVVRISGGEQRVPLADPRLR